MEFVIVSGLSGAGKSSVLDIMEDRGFYCVDNMPMALLSKFAELCMAVKGQYERVALVTDIRERDNFSQIIQALEELERLGCAYKILFVEADLPTIVRRYKETRRRHPLMGERQSIEEAVLYEKRLLTDLRKRADYIIDTSQLTKRTLQSELFRIFSWETGKGQMPITVLSFGFKHGIPLEADLVFDVRFLPNPYYIEELKEKTGMEKEVADYVMDRDVTRTFMQHLTDLLGFLVPQYLEEGKTGLTIAIGCTGGHHRSVAVANAVQQFLLEQDMKVQTIHRDMEC
ncbi:MAG: RNase adapter RapZ [Oscillospiraceae bacterium]|jgi:UPF0042 nucleotide-binding protein